MSRSQMIRTAFFLAVTFALTWGSIAFTARIAGTEAFLHPSLPPLGMLIPAFVALCFQLSFRKGRGFSAGEDRQYPQLILYAYMLLTIIIAAMTFLALANPSLKGIFSPLGEVLFILWTLLIIRSYRQHGEGAFRKVGLQLGDTRVGVRFVIGVVLFFILQAGLNIALGLAEPQGIQSCIAGIVVPPAIYPLALLGFFLLSVVGTPLGSLAATFGEEYAWRGFLQQALLPLGRRLGTLIVGLVWAIWHLPIILTNVHTYPPTPTGFLFALIFFVLWGYVQSYAVMKTDSIWTAVFMHGVVNSVYPLVLTYLARPENKLFSFGLGAYGLACLAIVVIVIQRDPIWKIPVAISTNESFLSPPQPVESSSA